MKNLLATVVMLTGLLAVGCGRPDAAVIVPENVDKYSTPPDAAAQMEKAAAAAANQRPANQAPN